MSQGGFVMLVVGKLPFVSQLFSGAEIASALKAFLIHTHLLQSASSQKTEQNITKDCFKKKRKRKFFFRSNKINLIKYIYLNKI